MKNLIFGFTKAIKFLPLFIIYSVILSGVVLFFVEYQSFILITFFTFWAFTIAHLVLFNLDFLKKRNEKGCLNGTK